MIIILFYILSAVTLSTAILTVLAKNPINSAVYMIISLFSVAGHFLMINAQFLAVVHVIVYTGAVMVLVLFTLMLMNLGEEHEPRKKIISRVAAVISSCLMLVLLLAVFLRANTSEITYGGLDANFQSIYMLGEVLLNEYLVPFEFTSVLLITAMIGSVLISKKDKRDMHPFPAGNAGYNNISPTLDTDNDTKAETSADLKIKGRSAVLLAAVVPVLEQIGINNYLYLSVMLFCVGVFGILYRRSTIVMLMSVELMLAAANLLLAAFSVYHRDTSGQIFVMFSMVVAAAEVAVGLAILVAIYRNTGTIDIDKLKNLKG